MWQKNSEFFLSKFDHSFKKRERKYCDILFLFYFYFFIWTKFSTKKKKLFAP
jgi:hypothetical protein